MSSNRTNKSSSEKYDELLSNMQKAKEKWDEEDKAGGCGVLDDEDRLLSEALDLAIQQGRGWSPGEKEEYLEKILDDDYIPPYFATTPEEVEKSGLQEAFTSLIYDGESPTSLMLSFKKKGSEAFVNGKRNEAGNQQYFRDAINHYYESLAWCEKIVPLMPGDLAQADTDEPTYTPDELSAEKSAILGNVALMHMQLKNWGHCRDECRKSLEANPRNVKAWYRLAKSYENLQRWENAGDAVDSGLAVDAENNDLKKLQRQIDSRVQKARKLRQQRERAKAERTAKIKAVWNHCKGSGGIKLGRVSLVSSASEDDDDDVDDVEEQSRWHHHLPHSGCIPAEQPPDGEWCWPCMFLYPSHKQSDFIETMPESQMLAIAMAQMFPEFDDDTGSKETPVVWDHNNEFTCSNLAVYFEVHSPSDSDGSAGSDSNNDRQLVHPESVEVLRDLQACIRFHEGCRALKGDEGSDLADVVRAIERRRLAKQQKAWKKQHGSLWHKPDPTPVVRVHPAATLGEVLRDPRMVVPNFLVTFLLFPENHPSHAAFLKEHKCLGIIQPKELEG